MQSHSIPQLPPCRHLFLTSPRTRWYIRIDGILVTLVFLPWYPNLEMVRVMAVGGVSQFNSYTFPIASPSAAIRESVLPLDIVGFTRCGIVIEILLCYFYREYRALYSAPKPLRSSAKQGSIKFMNQPFRLWLDSFNCSSSMSAYATMS